MSEATEVLQRAFAYHLKTGAALLYAWKGNQTPERLQDLTDLEEKGMRIGISVNMPADRWIIQVFMLDPHGETVVLDTIEQAGPLPSVN